MKKVVFKIEQQECDEIRELFEKKLALENLTKIIAPQENPDTYSKLIDDYGRVIREFNEWWDALFKKYQCEQGNYLVNFTDCVVESAENL